jgi:CubicO group peptidase (beta-lactamase class C family)
MAPSLQMGGYHPGARWVAAPTESLHKSGLSPAIVKDLVEALADWQQDLGAGGMQVALFKDGYLALSAWSGTDHFTGQAIGRETLFPLLSATKGVATLTLLHLHHLGYFSWRDRISRYWPAFGAQHKYEATVEHLLSHRLGLPNLTADWRHWPDRDYMCALVERAAPQWQPGMKYGYHGGSWGLIVDELVRRWTGRETGEILRTALAGPLGARHLYIGLPRERYQDVARLAFTDLEQRNKHPSLAPFGPDQEHNSPDVLASCQSSSGGVASAEDLARLYNLAALKGSWQGQIYWNAAGQAEASRPRNDPLSEAPAARPDLRFAWGLGFMTSPSADVFGTSPLGPSVIGHPGASGAIGYADPGHRVSLAFTINGVGGRGMYARYRLLGDLVRSALYSAV